MEFCPSAGTWESANNIRFVHRFGRQTTNSNSVPTVTKPESIRRAAGHQRGNLRLRRIATSISEAAVPRSSGARFLYLVPFDRFGFGWFIPDSIKRIRAFGQSEREPRTI